MSSSSPFYEFMMDDLTNCIVVASGDNPATKDLQFCVCDRPRVRIAAKPLVFGRPFLIDLDRDNYYRKGYRVVDLRNR